MARLLAMPFPWIPMWTFTLQRRELGGHVIEYLKNSRWWWCDEDGWIVFQNASKVFVIVEKIKRDDIIYKYVHGLVGH